MRSVLIALASTVVVAVVLGIAIVNTPGWDTARETFFSPEAAVRAFPAVLQGLWLNIRVLFFAAIAVAVLGTLLAVMRSLRGPVFFPLRALATIYVDFFRGVPVLIVLYLVGLGIPTLGIFPRIDAAVLGTVAITLCYSAYVGEVLRRHGGGASLTAHRGALARAVARADAAHGRRPAGRAQGRSSSDE